MFERTPFELPVSDRRLSRGTRYAEKLETRVPAFRIIRIKKIWVQICLDGQKPGAIPTSMIGGRD